MRLAKKSVHRSDGDAPNLCIRGLMADTVPIFTTRRLLPHSGRHLPPLPWLHPFDRPVSDTPPHQPQRRLADGRGHPAHLAEIGSAHVCTPVTNAHPVCRLLL